MATATHPHHHRFDMMEHLHDEIAERAYEFFLKRKTSGVPGSALEDWIHAETEVLECHGLHRHPLWIHGDWGPTRHLELSEL